MYPLQMCAAVFEVDGGELLCFLRSGDFAVIGAPPVLRADRLVGAVFLYSHTGEKVGWSGHNTGIKETLINATFW